MPIKPNGVVQGALLGGCRVHKNIEQAEEAIRPLSALDQLREKYCVNVVFMQKQNAGKAPLKRES